MEASRGGEDFYTTFIIRPRYEELDVTLSYKFRLTPIFTRERSIIRSLT